MPSEPVEAETLEMKPEPRPDRTRAITRWILHAGASVAGAYVLWNIHAEHAQTVAALAILWELMAAGIVADERHEEAIAAIKAIASTQGEGKDAP